jgi:peptidoglycan hydrolase CwlO-like protein
MSTALLVSLLLLGSPIQSVQDSVSARRVEKLENRISELEKQILEYEAREDYFQSILASQRWTFITVVTLFAALISLVGFGVFKRYIGEVEEVKSDMENRMEEELERLSTGLEEAGGRVGSLNEQVKEYEEKLSSTEEELTGSIEETRNDCMEHTSLSVAKVETEIQVLRTAIMKLDDKVEGLTHYPEGEEE